MKTKEPIYIKKGKIAKPKGKIRFYAPSKKHQTEGLAVGYFYKPI